MFAFVLSWKKREMREAADQRPIERKMIEDIVQMAAGWSGRFCRNDIDFAWKNHNFRASERETVTAHHVLPRALHVRRLQKRTVESTPQTQETQAIAC